MAAAIGAAPAAHAATATLPANTSIVGIGTVRNVDLTLSGAAGIEAADIDIDYDQAIVAINGDAVAGALATASQCQLTTNGSIPGRARIGVACIDPLGAGGVLLSIPFRSVAVGSTPLTLSRCSLNEDAIACSAVHGQISVALPTPTATPSATFTRTATPASTRTNTQLPAPTATPASLQAAFVSQTVPSSMTGGQQYAVSITMRNTGTVAWTAGTMFRLGAVNPYDNSTWGMGRVGLAAGDSIAPGAQKTFSWTVIAPSTAGAYPFQWRMVRDGVAWFGDLSSNVAVTVSGSTIPNAAYVTHSVPSSMTAGQEYAVSVTMRNNGGTTWTPGAFYRLGAINPYDSSVWGFSRVMLSATDSVAPAAQKTFNFTVRAPATPGTYNFQWRMVQDGVTWFGDPTANSVVTVTAAGPPNAAYVSRIVSTTMNAGQQYSVHVTMQNTGGTTWTPGALYRLGAVNPYDNTTWGLSRALLFNGESIAPGQQKTFAFTVRAPTAAGTYNFQWRMVQDGVTWFGDFSENAVITVR